MITLNTWAADCLHLMRRRFKIPKNNPLQCYSLAIMREWIKIDKSVKAINDAETRLDQYSEKSMLCERLADLIVYCVATMKQVSDSEDVEVLIKKRLGK